MSRAQEASRLLNEVALRSLPGVTFQGGFSDD